MSSLVRLESGHEFLLGPQRPLARPAYGARFDQFDTSGFDDCVPTVAPCLYPSGPKLPDHGELWSAPAETEAGNGSLRFSLRGAALAYRFGKTIRCEQSELILDYEIANLAGAELHFLWSAHPLLRVEPGARIRLPSEVRELLVQYSLGDRLGAPGSTCGWPAAETRDGAARLDLLLAPDAGFADKLFTPPLGAGYCSLEKPGAKERIEFEFDSASVPHLGLWICQGGWPDRTRGHYTVGLEPASARYDALSEACACGEQSTLRAYETRRWRLKLKLSAYHGPIEEAEKV